MTTLRSTIALCCLASLLAGCGDGTKVTAPPMPAEAVELSTLSPKKLDAWIAAADDVFEVVTLRDRYAAVDAPSSATLKDFDRKRDRLLRNYETHFIGDGVDLVAMGYDRIGEGRYRISVLIHIKQQLKGDYPHIHMIAYVQPQDQALLDGRKCLQWMERVEGGVQSIKSRTYLLVKREVEAPPVPLKLRVGIAHYGYSDECFGWVGDP